ncbi:leukemia inhibitory factor receptor-like [Leucoraja erinacea]|uniref:leukemia inhibitory factor receptor-like n=1 Tax=Leucoraja erinaceus TaxID=7782 RepID=UPI0024548CAA|nr:leukemia inhibitory factor receptor-like [Leucoraja erinacea]
MARVVLQLLLAPPGTLSIALCVLVGFTQSSRNCQHAPLPGSQGGPHDLDCYFIGDIKNGLNCLWRSGTHDTNNTRYILKIHWRENSSSKKNTTIPGIAIPFHTIPRSKLYISATASIWVETMNTCEKSKPITLVPLLSERPEPPSDIKYSWISGRLHLQRRAQENYLHQMAIRKVGTIEWRLFNFTQAGTIDELEQPAAYEFKARCKTISATSLWSLWSHVNYVPPELIYKLQIHTSVNTSQTDPGKRSVSIHWEAVKDSRHNCTWYNITIERLPPAEPRNVNTIQVGEDNCDLQLSQAPYKVRVQAYNSASRSPASEIVISPCNPIELRNKITATALGNDSLFISWNPMEGKWKKYVIDWGPVIGNQTHITHSKVIPKKLQNYTLMGQFHPKQRYRIMLHKRAKKRHKLTPPIEVTIGIVDVYTVEGTPRVGPPNIIVSDILKSSAVIRWDHIPEDECQGFLQGYKIFYYSRDSSKSNLTYLAAVTVNSSTTNYTLTGLLHKTFYALEISGFTKAGEGAKSRLVAFETNFGALVKVAVGVCIAITILVFLVSWICTLLVKRIKKIFWPNIPNPGNSHAIRIMRRVSSTPQHVVGSPCLHASLLEIESDEALENLHTIEEITTSLTDCRSQESEASNALEHKPLSDPAGRLAAAQVTDYTTMEDFQQIMPMLACNNTPSRSEAECDGRQQSGGTVIQSYLKQRVHHAGTDPTAQNTLIPLAPECPELLDNFDNIKATQTLHSPSLWKPNS